MYHKRGIRCFVYDRRLPERFWTKVIPEPNSGCWLWIGGQHDRKGYGCFWLGQSESGQRMAHRIAYLKLVGEIPPGMHIDHKCRTTCCVNPDHLRIVTPDENFRLGAWCNSSLKEHAIARENNALLNKNRALNQLTCKNGHQRNGLGRCSICAQERNERRRYNSSINGRRANRPPCRRCGIKKNKYCHGLCASCDSLRRYYAKTGRQLPSNEK